MYNRNPVKSGVSAADIAELLGDKCFNELDTPTTPKEEPLTRPINYDEVPGYNLKSGNFFNGVYSIEMMGSKTPRVNSNFYRLGPDNSIKISGVNAKQIKAAITTLITMFENIDTLGLYKVEFTYVKELSIPIEQQHNLYSKASPTKVITLEMFRNKGVMMCAVNTIEFNGGTDTTILEVRPADFQYIIRSLKGTEKRLAKAKY